jgi:hypothetical protein
MPVMLLRGRLPEEALMTDTMERALTWAPRILCLLFAAFLSIFAADVFMEGRPFLLTLAALAMHLIPSALVVLLVVVAWRHEWIGALAAVGLAVFWMRAKGPQLPWVDWAMIAGPLLLIAGLYGYNAIVHRHGPEEHRGRATAA